MHLYTPNSALLTCSTHHCSDVEAFEDRVSILPNPTLTSPEHPVYPTHLLSAVAHLLSPERAALCESSLATSRLAQDLRAAGADNDGLCVREDGRDSEAAGTLDVHEEGSWCWYEGLQALMSGILVTFDVP